MAALPANPTPTISPAEMQILVSRAGLVLNPGQVADLVLAWRQVAGLIAGLPQDRPMADDMAVGFRLPPPAASGAPARPAATDPAPARATPAPQPKRAPAKRAPAKRAPAKPTPAKAPPAKARAKTPAKAPTKVRPKAKAAVKARSTRKPAAPKSVTRRR
jgi:hypothetical protein